MFVHNGQFPYDCNPGVDIPFPDVDASMVGVLTFDGTGLPSLTLKGIMLYRPCLPCHLFSGAGFPSQALHIRADYG